jgi:hypothetical protein
MHFRGHILLYILLPLVLLSAAASFYRFVVTSDYIVEYEGECDPAAESCFEGCEDDECTEPYPYKQMQKYASDLRAACGPDITDCEAASVCLPGDAECSVLYCDPEQLGEDEYCAEPEEEETVIEEEGSVEDATEEDADEEALEETDL